MTSHDFSLLAEMSIQGSEMREYIPKVYKEGEKKSYTRYPSILKTEKEIFAISCREYQNVRSLCVTQAAKPHAVGWHSIFLQILLLYNSGLENKWKACRDGDHAYKSLPLWTLVSCYYDFKTTCHTKKKEHGTIPCTEGLFISLLFNHDEFWFRLENILRILSALSNPREDLVFL